MGNGARGFDSSSLFHRQKLESRQLRRKRCDCLKGTCPRSGPTRKREVYEEDEYEWSTAHNQSPYGARNGEKPMSTGKALNGTEEIARATQTGELNQGLDAVLSWGGEQRVVLPGGTGDTPRMPASAETASTITGENSFKEHNEKALNGIEEIQRHG
jgi:hypothetical protein